MESIPFDIGRLQNLCNFRVGRNYILNSLILANFVLYFISFFALSHSNYPAIV